MLHQRNDSVRVKVGLAVDIVRSNAARDRQQPLQCGQPYRHLTDCIGSQGAAEPCRPAASDRDLAPVAPVVAAPGANARRSSGRRLHRHPVDEDRVAYHLDQHRAELAYILSSLGHSPGNLDLVIYLRQPSQ